MVLVDPGGREEMAVSSFFRLILHFYPHGPSRRAEIFGRLPARPLPAGSFLFQVGAPLVLVVYPNGRWRTLSARRR
jgi:hypothetical protein